MKLGLDAFTLIELSFNLILVCVLFKIFLKTIYLVSLM